MGDLYYINGYSSQKTKIWIADFFFLVKNSFGSLTEVAEQPRLDQKHNNVFLQH